MKLTVEIKTTKTFEIDSDVFQEVEGLEGEEALNKIVAVVGEWHNIYTTHDWCDSDKIELLERSSCSFSQIDEIQSVAYEQRYRVYDYEKQKTLFTGNYEECSQFLTDSGFSGRDVDIIVH